MNTVNITGTFRNGVYTVPTLEYINLSDDSLLCASPESSTEQFNDEVTYVW